MNSNVCSQITMEKFQQRQFKSIRKLYKHVWIEVWGSLTVFMPPQKSYVHACVHAQSLRPCPTLWTTALQAPLSMGVSRQEYWSGLPCPPPGDLPDPGTEHTSPVSSALAGGFFTPWALEKPIKVPESLSNTNPVLIQKSEHTMQYGICTLHKDIKMVKLEPEEGFVKRFHWKE